jgi:xylitol oxidase
MSDNPRNWAGNYTYQALRRHHPRTVAEVQAIVRQCDRLHVLGSRHSFNGIADSPQDLLVLDQLERVVQIDPEEQTATVDGGITYGQLCEALDQAGYALPNLASLPHLTVAGACATATHGSGDRQGGLATAVRALDLVLADGSRVRLTRGDPEFAGAVVGLGGVGVVVGLTLDLVPAFSVAQTVYEALPLATLFAHFDAITGAGYSVSLFTDWQQEGIDQVWVKRRLPEGANAPAEDFFGATPAPADRHPIRRLAATPCTPQLGVPGPWYDRLPHFRLAFTPSSGAELQSEYLVPRQHAVAALQAVAGLRAAVAPLLQVSEIRTIAADDLWMSPCYGQARVGIHFTWHPDWAGVQAVLPRLEAALAPFGAVPHWGKLFTLPPAAIQAAYPRLPDFQALLARLDPTGKFRNPFLDTYLFGR